MFLKVVFITLCSFLTVACINLTYIVKKDENVIYPSCIAEERERYAAIGWIYPIPNEVQKIPNISTKILPTIEDDYNCKFSKNGVCNTRWLLRDWRIDITAPASREPLFDNRWEDLPTILISNETKEFIENFELNDIPRVSFTVRAEGVIELFFCSGWNPYNYPCYYFHMDYRKILFKVYPTLPKNNSEEYKKNILQDYLAFTDILSHSEWRSFDISFTSDGKVKLVDLNLERTLIETTVTEKIDPLYMFMRSENASLWKFHENFFLQTNTPQISRLGPQLRVNSKDLCISLLVATCETCEMSFFYLNGTTKSLLKYVGPMKTGEWLEIKLKEENILIEKVNLFVETKFINASSQENGFWAIDNVRICNENEVKVTYLIPNNATWSETEVTCQVIKKPNWRPKPKIFNKIKDFPQVKTTSGTDTLKLVWDQEDPLNQINYFISYKANDLCTIEPYNRNRMTSAGFLSTKLNEVVLNNLVPFTLYNVTIFTVLHEHERSMFLHTLETDELKLEELPYKVQVRPLDTAVNVTWEPVSCEKRFGRIIYSVIVSNNDLNFTKTLSLQTDTSYQIDGLQPFTKYTLTIIAARNGRNIYQNKFINVFKFNFTTSAAVAPPVQNLELYSIDKSSASLRFDLPLNPHGITREVQVSKCNALSFRKCKSTNYLLRECSFWPGKYCVDVQHLIPSQTYSFRVSLKNINTHTFGKEVSIDGFTNDRVPGAPTNVTYRIVGCNNTTDFCHLNISWLHPYNQNGSIAAFNIILNSTDELQDLQDSKSIEEVYKIENNTYYPYYTYQIKYLPYNKHYHLYLQSENLAYKSEFTHISVKTDNIGDHIDQSPKLLSKTESSLMFQLPTLDKRLDYYEVTVVVQDYNSKVKVDPAIMKNKKISNHLCHRYGNSWISQNQKIRDLRIEICMCTNVYENRHGAHFPDYYPEKINSSKVVNISIGKDTEKERLKAGEKYCIVFVITNHYKKEDHDVVYYEKLRLLEATSTSSSEVPTSEGGFNPLYLLLLVLLLIPMAFLIYRYIRRNKRKPHNTVDNRENVYETLPFEECYSTTVENENYDKLIHE